MYRTIANIVKNILEESCFRKSAHVEPSRRSTRHRKGMDYLVCEERRLLAGIEFTAATGQVLIGGTNADDVAQVTQSGSAITVTQQGFGSRTFNVNDVNSIFFVGLSGNDFFNNQSSINSVAYGQNGNDTLIGGSGNDRLVGNGGNDDLRGSGGNDVIIAGIGSDQVDAGAGNDRVLGIAGTNTIEGGAGDDTIYGGNDSLLEAPGMTEFMLKVETTPFPVAQAMMLLAGMMAMMFFEANRVTIGSLEARERTGQASPEVFRLMKSLLLVTVW